MQVSAGIGLTAVTSTEKDKPLILKELAVLFFVRFWGKKNPQPRLMEIADDYRVLVFFWGRCRCNQHHCSYHQSFSHILHLSNQFNYLLLGFLSLLLVNFCTDKAHVLDLPVVADVTELSNGTVIDTWRIG